MIDGASVVGQGSCSRNGRASARGSRVNPPLTLRDYPPARRVRGKVAPGFPVPRGAETTEVDRAVQEAGIEQETAGRVATRPPFSLYPPRGRKGLDPTVLASFASRLAAFRKAVLSQPQPRLYSALQILDFGQIHLRFGRRWEELREKIFLIIEHALDRAIGPDDLYLLVDEEHAYLLLTGRRRAEAEARARLVAAEITQRLCGLVPGGTAMRVRTLPFDFDSGLRDVVSPRQLHERIATFNRQLEDRERRAFRDHVMHFRARYRPLVHLRKSLVSAYRVEALLRRPDAPEAPAETVCEERINGVFDAELDGWILRRAGEALRALRGRLRAFLVLPVHYETLAARRLRDSYLPHCRALPANAARHLVFELLDLPPGMPQASLQELVSYLRPFAFTLAARIEPELLTAEHLEGCDIRFLTASWYGERPAEDSGERERVELWDRADIARFVVLGREARMRTAMLEIEETGALQAVAAAGIDYGGGPLIAPPLAEPRTRHAGGD